MAEQEHILDWNGAAALEFAMGVLSMGLTTAAADAVDTVKPQTPWLTGTYRNSIFAERPERDGSRVSILWGSHDVTYAGVLEFGTEKRRAYRNLGRGMDYISPRVGKHILRAWNA